jgi:hypothetical protein
MPDSLEYYARQGYDIEPQTKKPLSEKQRLAAQRRSDSNRDLVQALKARGLRANLKTRHALRKWRREGKSNNAFAASNQATPATVRQSTRRIAIEQPFQEAYTIPATTRRVSSKPKRELPVQQFSTNQVQNVLQTTRKQRPVLKRTSEQLLSELMQNRPNPITVQPKRKSDQMLEELLQTQRTQQPIKKSIGHSEAGKKAATSAKGRAWLDDVRKAKNLLDKVLREAGINEKGHQMDARRLASALRKNQQEANQVIQTVVQNAKLEGQKKKRTYTRKQPVQTQQPLEEQYEQDEFIQQPF